MDDVLLMFHLLHTNASNEVYGGYSLYDYSLPWYQTHLWQDGIVLCSSFLPDRLAKFQGNLPFFHNPAKTVAVRRNVEHLLKMLCEGVITTNDLEGFSDELRARFDGQRML